MGKTRGRLAKFYRAQTKPQTHSHEVCVTVGRRSVQRILMLSLVRRTYTFCPQSDDISSDCRYILYPVPLDAKVFSQTSQVRWGPNRSLTI